MQQVPSSDTEDEVLLEGPPPAARPRPAQVPALCLPDRATDDAEAGDRSAKSMGGDNEFYAQLQVAAMAVIDATQGADTLAITLAMVDQAQIRERLQGFPVALQPIALIQHRAIPVQTVAIQLLQYLVAGTTHFTGWVQIFHAH